MIKIELDAETMNRVIRTMNQIEGKSAEKVFKKAVNETAKKAQKELARKARQIYASPASAGILKRSTIKKATASGAAAEISFKSDLRHIASEDRGFRYTPKKPTPTKYSGHRRKAYRVAVSQFRQGKTKELTDGFVIKVKGHNIVVTRGKRIRGDALSYGRAGKRLRKDALKTVLGSSDRAMVRNDKVYGVLQDPIHEFLLDQVEKSFRKALGR